MNTNPKRAMVAKGTSVDITQNSNEALKSRIIKQTIILFFAIGLMLSCSERNSMYEHPTIQKIHNLREIDFDNIEGVRHFVTTDIDEAIEWESKELDSGRHVSGIFNRETGEYIYKSIPSEKISLPTGEEIFRLAKEKLSLTDEEILRLAKEKGCLLDEK
jgi:hypothetical protein